MQRLQRVPELDDEWLEGGFTFKAIKIEGAHVALLQITAPAPDADSLRLNIDSATASGNLPD